jgi:predicted O-methyltransferase YrrM
VNKASLGRFVEAGRKPFVRLEGKSMKRLMKSFLDRMPYIRGLRHQIADLQKQVGNLRDQVEKQGMFLAGHYFSPIPDQEEVLTYIQSRKNPTDRLEGIDLNRESQQRLLHDYVSYYKDLQFPEKQKTDFRYYSNNGWYPYADAIFLYSFLRKHQPKRIIEIGSGFSSAVMLDTVERFFSHRPDMIFIEPYPDRLRSLLRSGDENQVTIIEKKIQEVPSELFSSLESGDLLFIDSSHVLKCNSDVQLLLFDILPHLPAGIFVHFHDVFYPFEYPSSWLTEGRYWNENYFLRAFLSYNNEWDIYFFNTYVAFSFNDFINEKMPLCAKNPGGSLYIQRKKKY